MILDTLYYTGGANTTYDAFAMGTPVVTLPTSFHRGRYTRAAYEQIGVMDCIAQSQEDYIKKALAMGTDIEYRKDISGKIKEACGEVFEDRLAVAELESFLEYVSD